MDGLPPTMPASQAAPRGAEPPIGDFLRYFLRLGTLGFGGPIALAGHMQKDLVDDRRWISKEDYLEGLALAQLMPGPLAAQLAMYLGWVRARVLGASLVSAAFILPSFAMTVAIAAAYVRYGGLSWIQGAFYGIGAAVIAIIARSAWKLTRLSLKQDRLLWAIFAVTALVTAATESEIVWVFLGGGVLAMLVRAPPRWRPGPSAAAAVLPVWLVSGLAGPQPDLLWRILGYFAAAGAFVFGSGLAIVPFLHGGVVNEYRWLTERQFLDAVAVAMITPGPVVITVAFIGYLVAGPLGAVMAGLGVFLPTYLFVVIPAPFYRRIAHNTQIAAFVAGVTAAATGAIAGAAFVLGRRAIVDLPTAAIALVTLLVLTRVKKAPEPLVILAAGVVGIALRGVGG
ncbi:MAG TPA: chromate transporter [Anaeromyxobacteraceae bacterium]|nr:chromate transporter [Anaeromyxobacteraceae bacterium]